MIFWNHAFAHDGGNDWGAKPLRKRDDWLLCFRLDRAATTIDDDPLASLEAVGRLLEDRWIRE
jgi:hypothetical protein